MITEDEIDTLIEDIVATIDERLSHLNPEDALEVVDALHTSTRAIADGLRDDIRRGRG